MKNRSLIQFAKPFAAFCLLWLPSGLAQSPAREPTSRRTYAAQYPFLANLAGTAGGVRLLAAINPDGSVRNVRVVAGPGLLSLPAKEMLSRWQFSPCRETATTCEVHVFHFVLDCGGCVDTDCREEVQLDLPSAITIRSRRRRDHRQSHSRSTKVTPRESHVGQENTSAPKPSTLSHLQPRVRCLLSVSTQPPCYRQIEGTRSWNRDPSRPSGSDL